MIGVLVVSHGRLAETLLATASEIVGTFELAETLSVDRREPLDDVRARIKAAVGRVDGGEGVLIIADMFGGTAANLALELVGGSPPIEVVTGANLPMLLKLSTALRGGHDLLALAQLLKFYGQRNIMVASEKLKEREQDAD